MNYFEYLNENLNNPTTTTPRPELNTTKPEKPVVVSNPQENDTQEVRSVNLDGVSIFNSASKEDIKGINYDNVLGKQEENPDNPVKCSPLEWVLKTFFGFKEVSEVADADKNGEISKEEAIEYINEMMKKDGNAENLSLEDFMALIEEYGINLNEYMQSAETTPLSVWDCLSNDMQPSLGYEGISAPEADFAAPFSDAAPTYASGASYSAPSVPKTIENMSLEELNEEKTKRVETLNEKLTDLKNVQSGNTEAIKAAKEAETEAKTAYETAVEKDEALKQYKDAIKANNQEIEENTQKINECKNNILDKELEVSNQEHAYNVAVSNLEALSNAVSTLVAKKGSLSDSEKEAELDAKIQEVQTKIVEQKKLVATEKEKLEKVQKELDDLKTNLSNLETQGQALEDKKVELDKIVDERASDVTKAAKNAYNEATQKVKDITAEEMKSANEAYDEAKKSVEEVNEKIKVAEANRIKSKYSFNDARAIYDEMNLESQGLNWEVFEMAMEGYKNLPDDKKSTGMLGIFDTTQSADKERYYLIDLNTKTVVGRSVMKTGSGGYMGDVQKANQAGSHSTLSGFEQIGSEYYSGKMGKQALNIIGLEEGINDNAYSKRTVVHYASGNSTWGCKGFGPVRNSNGSVDIAATNDKMRKLWPQGTIMFTYPTDPNYKKLIKLYDAA